MNIQLVDITKDFKQVRAVDALSMEIQTGEALGLVGPNGSGKSTLLKIMLGMIKPSSGQVLIDGDKLSEKGWKQFRKQTGYMPERISFYENLTGTETLRLFARIKGAEEGRMDNIIRRILPDDAMKRRVGEYSKGMRQRLNLAQTLLSDPDLLILDEPTSGLDPIGTKEFYNILDEVRMRKKLTVILSSHILAEIEDKTDRVAVIKNGLLKAIGRLEDLYKGLKLPLWIAITMNTKDDVIENILRSEGALDCGYKNGYLIASVPREKKLQIISAIMEKKDRFIDFSIREPSLEEVFFGVH